MEVLSLDSVVKVPRYLVFGWVGNCSQGGWKDLIGWSLTEAGASQIVVSKRKIIQENLKISKALNGDVSYTDEKIVYDNFCWEIIDMKTGKRLHDDDWNGEWKREKWNSPLYEPTAKDTIKDSSIRERE